MSKQNSTLQKAIDNLEQLYDNIINDIHILTATGTYNREELDALRAERDEAYDMLCRCKEKLENENK